MLRAIHKVRSGFLVAALYLKTPSYNHLVPFGPPVPLPPYIGLSIIIPSLLLILAVLAAAFN
jgi:hypothetical protein